MRRQTTLTARVVAASGAAVPNVNLELQIAGAGDLPKSVRTGADGVARIPITPTDAKGGVRGAIRSQLVAAPSPAIYTPRRADAARNGQRLAGPATTRASAAVAFDVTPAQIAVTTTATPATLIVGEASRDSVSIAGAFGGWRADVEVRLYGPARTRDAIDCTGEPAATTTYNTGAGPSMTPVLRPARTGWYGYQLVIPSSDDVIGLTTPCGEASELLKVEAQPTVKTQVSAPAVEPGAAVTDTALVEGLGGETVTVVATLYGPYAARRQDHLRGPARVDGLLRGLRRRVLRDRTRHADRARLLHLPRVDRGERVRATGADAVRRDRPRRRSCAAVRRSRPRSARRRPRRGRRSPTASS